MFELNENKVDGSLIAIKKISAGVYLKFNDELNLSLDDCEKITEFMLNEYKNLVGAVINELSLVYIYAKFIHKQ